MTLTPSLVRFDLKCGKGSISAGEKCTKGSGRNVRANLENAAIAAGIVGNIASFGAGMHQLRKGNLKKANRIMQAQGGFAALQGAGELSKANRTGDKELRAQGQHSLTTGALGVWLGSSLAGDFNRFPSPSALGVNIRARGSRFGANLKGKLTQRSQRQSLERMFNNPQLPPADFKGDSIWADGFAP